MAAAGDRHGERLGSRATARRSTFPPAPRYRVEKEIKNVVTVIAKTCHYWTGHMWRAQKREIADLFAKMADASPLVEPALASADRPDRARGDVSRAWPRPFTRTPGSTRSRHRYAGWLGLECTSVGTAIWMMRALVASNILSRREETTLFVPVNPATDVTGDIVVRAVSRIHRLAERRR